MLMNLIFIKTSKTIYQVNVKQIDITSIIWYNIKEIMFFWGNKNVGRI